MKVFIFSNKDAINLPTAPTSVSFTAGDFHPLMHDCELAEKIFVFNLRSFVQSLYGYANGITYDNRTNLAYRLIDIVSPFIKITPTVESYGIILTDEFTSPSKYYNKTFYIRSALENDFISSLSKEDQITINTTIQTFEEKSYTDDKNILIDLYSQGDKLYEITI